MTTAVKVQTARQESSRKDGQETAQTVDLEAMGRAAQQASRKLALLTSTQKNGALHAIAAALELKSAEVLAQNELDITAARANGLSDALLDRLLLTPERMRGLADDTRQVAALPDPVGAELESRLLPNGMRLSRRRIPIGVLGVIYEARPNTTIDIAVLCLKTGNAVILRGGKETRRSNLALVSVISDVLHEQGLPSEAIQYIGNPDRELVSRFLRMDEYIDMLIPRGGNNLHRLCREQSTIPVITGGIGICHYYVDVSADQERGLDVIVNARTQRPSVCNALDTLLVNCRIASEFLPKLARRMAECGVEMRAAPDALPLLSGHGATVKAAGPDDWDTEWMALILGVKLVDSMDEAIEHIQEHSQDHSDGILTNDWNNAQRFIDAVNSSAVFVNASTRFNDGGQFGLGAEVAISTQKLHARGPMGLEELTTYKWVALGDMHVRA